MFGYFYHGTIRKYVVAFGTLFNNIYIDRKNKDGQESRYRVPLSYSEKDKYIRRLQEFPYLQSDENNPEIAFSYLPRMSFEMSGLNYDPTRKRNTLTKVYEPSANKNNYSYTFAEVPYNIDFNVHIMARKMEDGLQIIEQILPYFTPEFTVTLDLGSFARKVDIPIVMKSYEQTIEYESEADDGTEHRILIWNMGFNVRGYLYGPEKNGVVIKKTITEFFDYNKYLTGTGDRLETVVVGATAGTGGIGTGATAFGYYVEIFGASASDSDIFG
jgi:T4-like virus Myoviridae tail sheath stabiliser